MFADLPSLSHFPFRETAESHRCPAEDFNNPSNFYLATAYYCFRRHVPDSMDFDWADSQFFSRISGILTCPQS